MAANKVTLGRLAAHVAGRLEGPDHTELTGIAELASAGPADLSFLINKHDLETAKTTKAAAVLVSDSLAPVSLPMIWVSNVPEAINMALELFARPPEADLGVHPTALIAPGVNLGHDLAIGPYVVVQAGTT
ncbi:MAG: UDP-3-O-(3-hydroxymyristoyl)glucosamine N-acyltransferase, partial [Phycisphaerae bacterium]|nr:UDP-3-O-(3-hydroxymyristoyl)glucosamine N-acyltransferase [Phycisphaerae bacterium]